MTHLFSLETIHINITVTLITVIIPLIVMIFIWVDKNSLLYYFSGSLWLLIIVIILILNNNNTALFDDLLSFEVLVDETSSKPPVVINRDDDLETMNSLVTRLENYIQEYIHVCSPEWTNLPSQYGSNFWRNFERQTGYVFTLVGEGILSNANPGNTPSQCIFFVERGYSCAIMIKYDIANHIPTTFHVYPGLDSVGTEASIDAWRSRSEILSQIPRTKFFTLQANLFS